MAASASESDQLLRCTEMTLCAIFDQSALQQNDLLDHLVSDSEYARWNAEAEHLGALALITSSNFVGCSTGRSGGFSPFRIRPT
jgi:hypothetical protein